MIKELIRSVIQDAITNWRAFFLCCGLPILVGAGIGTWQNIELWNGRDAEALSFAYMGIVLVMSGIAGLSWARFVVVEKYPSASNQLGSVNLLWPFMLRQVAVALVCLLPAGIVMYVMLNTTLASSTPQSQPLSIFDHFIENALSWQTMLSLFVACCVYFWLHLRIGLSIVWIAIEAQEQTRTSWALTRPVSRALFGIAIIAAVIQIGLQALIELMNTLPEATDTGAALFFGIGIAGEVLSVVASVLLVGLLARIHIYTRPDDVAEVFG